jgi:hypothetical protein
VPVEHQGNQHSSPEEGEAIQRMVAEMLGAGTNSVDRKGEERAVTPGDILIIAPYNARMFGLKDQLPSARIGLRREVATESRATPESPKGESASRG